MRTNRVRFVTVALLLLAGCGGSRPARLIASATMPAYVDPAAESPQIRYDDGQVSLDDHCPIRKHKLNLKMPPVYVNGRPVGFC